MKAITVTLSLALAAGACAPPAGDSGIDPEIVRAYLLEGIDQSRDMDVRFAQAIPDSAFTWAPTADVRNFGQQIAHAANNYWVAAGLQVEAPAFPTEFTDAAALAAAITTSYDWLAEQLRALPAEDFTTTADFFGTPTQKWRMFTQAVEHAFWTRGQTVPYFHAHGVDVPQVTFF